jgi:hypothetical protein
MLVEVDDVVLLRSELALHVLGGDHAYVAFLRLNLWIRFHIKLFPQL